MSRAMPTTVWAAAIAIAISAAPTARAATLDHVRAVQRVACGAVLVQDDFTKDDTHGSLGGLAIDFCRAVAAVVLGDPQKSQVTLYPDQNHALTALQAGQSDLMIGTSATADRAALFGLAYAPPLFVDGQSFMVDRADGIRSFADLAGKPVCYISGTENERRLLQAASLQHVAINQHPFEEVGEMEAALVTGHCTAVAADMSQLAEDRQGFHARRSDFVILPDLIALDPVTPAYEAADPQWGAVIAWTRAALIEAEELGIGQSSGPRELLSSGPQIAHDLGLANDWPARAVQAVGNYGEMFERTLGMGSDVRLIRNQSRLWRDGGLMWAPPLQ